MQQLNLLHSQCTCSHEVFHPDKDKRKLGSHFYFKWNSTVLHLLRHNVGGELEWSIPVAMLGCAHRGIIVSTAPEVSWALQPRQKPRPAQEFSVRLKAWPASRIANSNKIIITIITIEIKFKGVEYNNCLLSINHRYKEIENLWRANKEGRNWIFCLNTLKNIIYLKVFAAQKSLVALFYSSI